jgi:hypothetical protein
LQVAVPVLNGRGRPEIEIIIQLVSIALFLVAVAWFAHGRTNEVLWALVIAYTLRVIYLLVAVGFLLSTGTQPILLTVLPGAVTATLVLAAEAALSEFLSPSTSEPERLAGMIGISLAVLVLAFLAHRGSLTGGLRIGPCMASTRNRAFRR